MISPMHNLSNDKRRRGNNYRSSDSSGSENNSQAAQEPLPIRAESIRVVDEVPITATFSQAEDADEVIDFLNSLFAGTDTSLSDNYSQHYPYRQQQHNQHHPYHEEDLSSHQPASRNAQLKQSPNAGNENTTMTMENAAGAHNLDHDSMDAWLPQQHQQQYASGQQYYPPTNPQHNFQHPNSTAFPERFDMEHDVQFSTLPRSEAFGLPLNQAPASSFGIPTEKLAQETSVTATATSATAKAPPAAAAAASPSAASSSSSTVQFRKYQADLWADRYSDLCDYRNIHGHCLVDSNSSKALARWVKRQRCQYKLKEEGKRSTLSDERKQLLENLGFVWDSHEAAWLFHFNELLAYKQEKGTCNVPTKYQENPSLGTWVKDQRRKYRLYISGQPSSLNERRIQRLDEVGFKWNVVPSKSPGTPPTPSSV